MYTNPILKSLKNFNYYLLFWGVLSFVFILLLYFGANIGMSASIADGLVFTFLLSGLGLTLWYPTRYISIESNKPAKLIVSHLVGAIVTTIIWLSLGYFIMVGMLGFDDKYPAFLLGTLIWRVLIGILFYSLITSFYYMIIYYTGFQERIIKEADLKNLVTEAELKSLKFQINPHFIFNSLNSMSALTEIDPPRAKQMIIKLAEFLRFILKTNELDKNSLHEELKNIRLYLDIERIRFEDKFEYEEKINEGCGHFEIPSMILQPLFENAIKHAVYETLDRVTLKLKCCLQDEFLKIELENNYDESAVPKRGAGVGLKNIHDRLKLIYHRDDLMKISNGNGIFNVTLYIPLAEIEQ
ncbi:sensor histidine kinase YpdA [bacterium BMS3Abin03]|nr:sensor histidine kinase YpdA [bacterium BMS3Abin03]